MCHQDSLYIANHIAQEVAKQLQEQAITANENANIISAASMVISFITLVIVYIQLERVIKSNHMENYMEIKKDFGSTEFRKLYAALNTDMLKFDYYKEIVKYKANNKEEEMPFTEFDHHFMNAYEEIAIIYKRGGITLDLIDAGYGYPILKIWSNKKIQEYVKNGRKKMHDTYLGLEDLYNEVYALCSDQDKEKYKLENQ